MKTELSSEDVEKAYLVAFRVSALLLTWMEEEVQKENLDPSVACLCLNLATARFAGRYGYRHLDGKKMWAALKAPEFEALFIQAFDEERQAREKMSHDHREHQA